MKRVAESLLKYFEGMYPGDRSDPLFLAATTSAQAVDARLKDELEGQHQGAANAGRPMLLEGGLDWKPMGFSPSDMEFQKTKEAAAREIALAFGVPPMLLGLPGDATYANYAEANRAFYRLTVLPLVGKVAGALSQWLPGMEGARLKPDLDGVPALALEREAQWRRVWAMEADWTRRIVLNGKPACVFPQAAIVWRHNRTQSEEVEFL